MNKAVDVKITDMKERYTSGVLKYRQMGYWEPDYVPKDLMHPLIPLQLHRGKRIAWTAWS